MYYAAYKQRILFEVIADFVGRLACGLSALHDPVERFEGVRTNLLISMIAARDIERCVDEVVKEHCGVPYAAVKACCVVAQALTFHGE